MAPTRELAQQIHAETVEFIRGTDLRYLLRNFSEFSVLLLCLEELLYSIKLVSWYFIYSLTSLTVAENVSFYYHWNSRKTQ